MKKTIQKIRQLLDELEKKETKIELEDHNFRVNSDGWKKITVDGKEYLEAPTGDIWEILENDYRGEQLFTWDAAIRETKKAGKRMPTDEEFDEITNDNIKNIVYPGYRAANGSFSPRGDGALLWSSSEYSSTRAWRRGLRCISATVSRYYYDKTGGFSVRCVKD